jgi:uncharacterized protein YbbK (DUF523 family)
VCIIWVAASIMIKVLVSACLLGERVRFHGGDASCASEVLDRWAAEGRIVPVCPEVAAGLPVPRPPAEIAGGDGRAVLRRDACVTDSTGTDVTDLFVRGARLTLEAAASSGAQLAVLKDGSPSCGSSYIHDGTFRGQRVEGTGVTAAVLSQAGIRVFNERQWEEAARYLGTLEETESSGRLLRGSS